MAPSEAGHALNSSWHVKGCVMLCSNVRLHGGMGPDARRVAQFVGNRALMYRRAARCTVRTSGRRSGPPLMQRCGNTYSTACAWGRPSCAVRIPPSLAVCMACGAALTCAGFCRQSMPCTSML